jgi:hypothetical protein
MYAIDRTFHTVSLESECYIEFGILAGDVMKVREGEIDANKKTDIGMSTHSRT